MPISINLLQEETKKMNRLILVACLVCVFAVLSLETASANGEY